MATRRSTRSSGRKRKDTPAPITRSSRRRRVAQTVSTIVEEEEEEEDAAMNNQEQDEKSNDGSIDESMTITTPTQSVTPTRQLSFDDYRGSQSRGTWKDSAQALSFSGSLTSNNSSSSSSSAGLRMRTRSSAVKASRQVVPDIHAAPVTVTATTSSSSGLNSSSMPPPKSQKPYVPAELSTYRGQGGGYFVPSSRGSSDSSSNDLGQPTYRILGGKGSSPSSNDDGSVDASSGFAKFLNLDNDGKDEDGSSSAKHTCWIVIAMLLLVAAATMLAFPFLGWLQAPVIPFMMPGAVCCNTTAVPPSAIEASVKHVIGGMDLASSKGALSGKDLAALESKLLGKVRDDVAVKNVDVSALSAFHGSITNEMNAALKALQSAIKADMDTVRASDRKDAEAARTALESAQKAAVGRLEAQLAEAKAAQASTAQQLEQALSQVKTELTASISSQAASYAKDKAGVEAALAEIREQLTKSLAAQAGDKQELQAALAQLKTQLGASQTGDVKELAAAQEAMLAKLKKELGETLAADLKVAKLALGEDAAKSLAEASAVAEERLASAKAEITQQVADSTREEVGKARESVLAATRMDVENSKTTLEASLAELRQRYEKLAAQQAVAVPSGSSDLDVAGVTRIVEHRLAKYSADKTDRVDYALHSAGGRVLAASKSHKIKMYCNPVLAMFRDCYAPVNAPREVLNDDMSVGKCWPMAGQNGWMLIRLRENVVVTDITYEHSPASITPDATTVPRRFIVEGVPDEQTDRSPDQMEGVQVLGQFEFDRASGGALQTFPMQTQDRAFRTIRVRVDGNTGNPDYTCLYRIRVHGHTGN